MGIANGGIIRRKVFFRAWIILCMLLNAVTAQSIEDEKLSSCELEALVKQLINPSPEYQMHAAALRNQLRAILQNEKLQSMQSLDDSLDDYLDEDKRSMGPLARGRTITYGKRYLGSLARSGMMVSPSDSIKRSLANLAKNGQLPTPEPDENGEEDYKVPQWTEKRNLGALAKSGGLTSGKRNIGTLARDFQLPSNAGKRNLAALAKLGFSPGTNPKRNVASLARLNSFYDMEKRNLAALKNSPVHGSNRQKREFYEAGDYEVPDEVIQNYSVDYDDLKNALNRLYGGPYEEKRFLGSVARSGWFRNVDKRNIGSLARLGLLRSDYNRYGNAAANARNTYRQQEQKRHIGALARSDTSPHKSDYDNPPRAFVDDATTFMNIGTNLVGEHRAQPVGEHHHDLPPYTGEVYDQLPPVLMYKLSSSSINNDNNNNNIPIMTDSPSSNYDRFDLRNILEKQNTRDAEEQNCAQRLNFMLDILGNTYYQDSSIDNNINYFI